MGPRTRSTSSSPVKVKATSANPAPQVEQGEPFRLFILPEDTSSTARFLLLRHPRDDCKKRFYFCLTSGLYEFTKVAAPSIDPRSILFIPADMRNEQLTNGCPLEEMAQVSSISQGYVNQNAEFFVATPFDVVFLLLPILIPKKTNEKRLFQPLDDLFENQLDDDKHLKYLLKTGRKSVEEAMARICDTVEAGDEKMYRINEDKLLQYILAKAERAVGQGLPMTLEEKFVTRTLEAPVLSIKREESSVTAITENAEETSSANEFDSFDTQSSTTTTTSSNIFSESASVVTVSTTVDEAASLHVRHLQRIRTAFDFITSSYVSIHLSSRLDELLAGKASTVNFEALHCHLKHLISLRAEALASRSLSDFSRKRGSIEDEDVLESRAEKKRKVDEEEKRKKAGESHGVRALKKVNVTGMRKMSDFFGKNATAAKAKS